ncbi:hypothetical protein, partial [Streptococcus dysgalactiae]|uniref:hypothetical protein n=1 Tax=Streptococcus dysgalactiae TaxID=1334 RepID=UPI001EF3D4BC
MRNTIKEDLHATPADLVFGQSLRLPGELVAPAPPAYFDYGDYAKRLAHHMRSLQPPPTRDQQVPAYLPKALSGASHVFVKVGGVRTPLQPPYTGPHRVLSRADKHYVVDLGGRRECVSIDRLKPAFVESSSSSPATPPTSSTPPTTAVAHPSSLPPHSAPAPAPV